MSFHFFMVSSNIRFASFVSKQIRSFCALYMRLLAAVWSNTSKMQHLFVRLLSSNFMFRIHTSLLTNVHIKLSFKQSLYIISVFQCADSSSPRLLYHPRSSLQSSWWVMWRCYVTECNLVWRHTSMEPLCRSAGRPYASCIVILSAVRCGENPNVIMNVLSHQSALVVGTSATWICGWHRPDGNQQRKSGGTISAHGQVVIYMGIQIRAEKSKIWSPDTILQMLRLTRQWASQYRELTWRRYNLSSIFDPQSLNIETWQNWKSSENIMPSL